MGPNTLNLRCQTVIDGRLGYVLVPVDRMLWETNEHAREHAERTAREELRHSAIERAGRDLPASDFEDLPVWVEYPDRCEVECVGGPHDGRRMTWNSAEPPVAIDLPVDEGISSLLAAAQGEPASVVRHAAYAPLMDDGGFFSRTQDGAWRYSFQR
ncbi:hypothetical protein GA0115253_107854 [Streptomyces sp. Termitarium-T10T-6]|nr:hypothetical protein [Streptomyces sp. Termitarium-T10T-6]SCE58518.1 hypothetical protein GA0115253_107854 [Streptomyces sp. Termitarium-T10T-6]